MTSAIVFSSIGLNRGPAPRRRWAWMAVMGWWWGSVLGFGGAPVGGGVLEGGFLGEYFANPEWVGSPAFTRRDVRIDFDWGEVERPGGSPAPGYRDVGTDAYSVRWSGRVMPRFTEVYTWVLEADESARFGIRRAGEAAFREVAAAGASSGIATGATPLEGGVVYEVRVEYRESAGAARVRLRWRSPGTPEEVVEAATLAALNVNTYADEIWANAMDGARDEWRDPEFSGDKARWPGRDALGWPRGDGGIAVWEGRRPESVAGRHRLSFTGRARVAAQGTAAEFFVNGVSVGHDLPSGRGWDAVSNMTTAEVEIAPVDILYLYFTETRRLPGDGASTGVLDVRLMRPEREGGGAPGAGGDRFDARARRAFGRYQALRWISNFETERTWSDRIPPRYSTHREVERLRHWELMIQLSNETGKDLYVCLPHRADDEYVRNVARMLRYGSDGVLPYDGPRAEPVHPPLNSNLRVYVERGNEVWNWSFFQAPESAEDGRREVTSGTANGAILNFDGENTAGDLFYRWHALRSVQMSEIFRAVSGDAAMGSRVRFLLEYQYDNDQGTAEMAYDFLDRYFNNGDGVARVTVPRPVNHFFWGGGGAAYYSSGNPQGRRIGGFVEDGGFEHPVAPDGAALVGPAGSGWVFSGAAGVYRRPTLADATVTAGLGAAGNPLTERTLLGFRFTVGSEPVGVYELGRRVSTGLGGYHELMIVDAVTRETVASGELLSGARPPGSIATAPLRLPVVLQPGRSYYLLCSESPGGDPFHDETTHIEGASGITVEGATSASRGTPDWDSTQWTYRQLGGPGTGFGPLVLRVAPRSAGTLGYPPVPPEGAQALWLAGTGAVSRVIQFPKPGTYALRFLAAAKLDRETGVHFTLDGRNITPQGESHVGPTGEHWVPGFGFNRNYRQFENNGSYVFTVDAPGPRTLRIAATGFPRYYNPFEVRVDPGLHIYFDAIEVASVDAIFEGGIPGNGEANGQPTEIAASYESRLASQARYAQAYGLQVVAYEGGWSLGGDFGAIPIQNWAKFADPRAEGSAMDSMDHFARSGGAMYTWGTYTTWPHGEIERADGFPLARGVDRHGASLPPPPANGRYLPDILEPSQARWGIRGNFSTGRLDRPGAWLGWNVISAATGVYEVVTSVSGSGRAQLLVDGRDWETPIDAGARRTNHITLSWGLHHLRVQSRGGTPVVERIEVRRPGAPEAPRIIQAADGDGRVTLSWGAGEGPVASGGYLIRYGTAPGVHSMAIDVKPAATTSLAVTGLVNGTSYYFAVAARNEMGVGRPSSEVASTPFADGESARLGVFEFTGLAGTEASAPPRIASSRIRLSPIARGVGLLPSTYPDIARDTFGSVALGDVYAQGFADSRVRGQYYEFSVEPAVGRVLALEELRFRPYFQNVTGEPGDPRGAGVALSTNGVDFVAVPARGIPSYFGTSEFVLKLDDVDLARWVTTPLVVRIHLFGNGPWEFSGLGGPGHDGVVHGRVMTSSNPARPRLDVVREGDRLRVEVRGEPGRGWMLERSRDLKAWEDVDGVAGGTEFVVPMGLEGGGVFYRVTGP